MTKFLSHFLFIFVIVGATVPETQVIGGGTPNPPKTEGSEAVHGSGTGALSPNSTGK